MTSIVQKPDLRILFVLTGLAAHYKKRYVYPSMVKILAKLDALYGVPMSARSLCRHLKALEQQGYIRRKRRISRCPIRGTVFRSTLYTITSMAERVVRPAMRSFAQALNFAAPRKQNSRVTKTAHHGNSQRLYNHSDPKPVDKSASLSSKTQKVGHFLAAIRQSLTSNAPG